MCASVSTTITIQIFNFTCKQMNGNSNNNTFRCHFSISFLRQCKWHSRSRCSSKHNTSHRDWSEIRKWNTRCCDDVRLFPSLFCSHLHRRYLMFVISLASIASSHNIQTNDILISLNAADKIVCLFSNERRLANRISHRVKSIPV